MIKVYIAGPYSEGNQAENVRIAIEYAEGLAGLGFAPFVPHLSHFWHYVHPHPYEFWMKFCLAWVESCDCLLRLRGESKGAEREQARMAELDRPIFYSIDEVLEYYPRSNNA